MFGVFTRLTFRQKHVIMLAVDVCLVPVALYLALAAHSSSLDLTPTIRADWELMPILMGLGLMLSYTLGLQRIQLNDYEAAGLPSGALYSAVLAVAGAGLNKLADGILPWSAFFTFGLILFFGLLAARMVMRSLLLQIYHSQNPRTAVVIYGAGRTGMQLASALRHDPRIVPVGFVDDNPALRRLTVVGLPVMSPAKLEDMIRKRHIQRVLLAMPSLTAPQKLRISRRLAPLGVDVQALPSFAQLVGEEELVGKLSSVNPIDFLPRLPFEDDLAAAMPTFEGRSVMVTGAGGSIGSELCRQILACRPSRLVLLENSELALYNIDNELAALSSEITVHAVLGSVCDARLCRQTMADHKVEVVLHAAAFKHVPLVEANPLSGLDNNVFGTKVLADAARDAGVGRFMLISTDKAVRPANVMGASKRLAEMIVQDMASRPSETLFSMVRFGNVLGSSGSVIPLFEQQIANGGPVTLTHADVTRYFMTIPEAARLVLMSCNLARGGDVFVLDMGQPVPIRKLAVQMIEAAGYTVRDATTPEGDIEIHITGLRLGEKLHEELLIGEERLTTPHPKITRGMEKGLSEIEVANALRDLRGAIDTGDVGAARAVLVRWVEGAMVPPDQSVG
ncbi:MAG: polysaccharide biosynthesis protein [Qingshengfaniella sp.]